MLSGGMVGGGDTRNKTSHALIFVKLGDGYMRSFFILFSLLLCLIFSMIKS